MRVRAVWAVFVICFWRELFAADRACNHLLPFAGLPSFSFSLFHNVDLHLAHRFGMPFSESQAWAQTSHTQTLRFSIMEGNSAPLGTRLSNYFVPLVRIFLTE